ncbi:unnamed protein product [Phytomonas sp. Hart1]|nr:unnamed protein product [Phytomonas sp. Hart1]|eukprot:CCW70690.1 unnamed protein product [Phytomonas sp. isolate Hart1]
MEEVIISEEPPHGLPAVVVGVPDPRLTERFLRIANQLHPLDDWTRHLKRIRRRPAPVLDDPPCEAGGGVELLLEGGVGFRLRCENALPDLLWRSYTLLDPLLFPLMEEVKTDSKEMEKGEEDKDSFQGQLRNMYRDFLHEIARDMDQMGGLTLVFRVVVVSSHGPSQRPELWHRWNSVWPLASPRPRPCELPSDALIEGANARMREKVLAICEGLVRGGPAGQRPSLLGIAAAVYDPSCGRWVGDSAGCTAMRRDNLNACGPYVERSRCPPTSTGVILEHPVIHVLKRVSTAAAEAKNISTPEMIEGREFVPYLATNLDLYVSHEPCTMCSMALVHSRIARVFYCFPNKVDGGLGSVHAIHGIASLNHHFRVYHCTKVEEEYKDRNHFL